MKKLLSILHACIIALLATLVHTAQALPNSDIIFVTQIPIPQDFTTVNATFGNQSGSVSSRGFGDLYIRYADGTLRNLSADAGHGNSGQQGAGSIAVRDPAVHWNGQKVIFSMVIGSATQRYQVNSYYWQLYELTNFGKNQTPVITKVPNQPENFNNVMPTYASDGATIIFASDRPRDGSAHLYPQRDEYESAATNTGLWSLVPSSGALKLLDHSPSGDFHPFIDSFGRVIFTRWDHLQRDQQADNESGSDKGYGAFNFSDESAGAQRLNSIKEYFPEHEDDGAQLEDDPSVNSHRFNQFFPWAVNQDGTNLETINHLGRHELSGYIPRSFKNDTSLDDFYGQYTRVNPRSINNFLHIKEDPTQAGLYYGIDCPEFGTHAAGQIIRMSAAPSLQASQIKIDYITSRATAATSNSPGADHSGLYRNPLPLSDGSMIASHTSMTEQDSNIGTSTSPLSKYAFRLKTVIDGPSGYKVSGTLLTSGINKSVTYWSPDELVTYSGPMWELQAVEVIARSAPTPASVTLEAPEQSVFTSTGSDINAVKAFLVQNNLALIVARNVTTRDSFDIQQPYNLKIEGGTETLGNNKTFSVLKFLQLFQGDQIRGYGSSSNTGRRVLAVPLHDGYSFNPLSGGEPTASVKLGSDGSFAALVPARRALSWQLTDPQGKAVVRERYWVTFQPGEIRVCASCHGITSHSQSGQEPPSNPPQALGELLRYIQSLPPGFAPPDSTPTNSPTASPTTVPTPSTDSIALSIKRASRSARSARFRLKITSSTNYAKKQVVIKLSLDENTCTEANKNLRLNDKGIGFIDFSIPRSTSSQTAVFEVYVNDTLGDSKSISVPGSKSSRRNPGQFCAGVK